MRKYLFFFAVTHLIISQNSKAYASQEGSTTQEVASEFFQKTLKKLVFQTLNNR